MFQVVVVGAGARLADVDSKTVASCLVTPLGSYSQLGVAGFTLLGGTGFLSRSYGCAADNAVEFGKPAVSKFDFLMKICGFPLLNTSLKFSSRNLFYFMLMGTLFLVHIMYFQFIIPFPYKLAEGQSWQGMQCKKKLLTIA